MNPAPSQPAPRPTYYPGSITYIDLIAKNKRQSVFLAICMIILAMLVGAAIAGLLAARGNADALASAIIGSFFGLVCALIGTAWSYFGGASAILSISGAREIEKADDPELFNVVDELRLAAGVPMPRVYLMDDSALNAMATGRDPAHAAVAITTGLRARLTRDELQGVMAHEMSHVRNYDIRFALLMATMVGLIVFACDAFWRLTWFSGPSRRSSRDDNNNSGGIGIIFLVLAILLSILAPMFAFFIQMAVSRQREYLADAAAVELTRNPEGLISALRKLAEDRDPLVDHANRGTAHLFIVNPLRTMRESGQQLDSPFSSHPPIQKRIERLEALLQ